MNATKRRRTARRKSRATSRAKRQLQRRLDHGSTAHKLAAGALGLAYLVHATTARDGFDFLGGLLGVALLAVLAAWFLAPELALITKATAEQKKPTRRRPASRKPARRRRA